MKKLIETLGIFIILTVIISGFAACSSAPKNVTGDKMPPLSNTTTGADNAQKAEKSADDNAFPAAPAALAKSEIRMLSGTPFKLETEQGNVILFNLWATWCGPCRAEMPELIQLQDKYRDKNFKIIGVDVDNESAEDVKAFGEKMKLNYDLGWLDETQMGEFVKISKFSGIPQSYLIDRKGRLRGVFAGGGPKVIGQLKDTLEKVVGE